MTNGNKAKLSCVMASTIPSKGSFHRQACDTICTLAPIRLNCRQKSRVCLTHNFWLSSPSYHERHTLGAHLALGFLLLDTYEYIPQIRISNRYVSLRYSPSKLLDASASYLCHNQSDNIVNFTHTKNAKYWIVD